MRYRASRRSPLLQEQGKKAEEGKKKLVMSDDKWGRKKERVMVEWQ